MEQVDGVVILVGFAYWVRLVRTYLLAADSGIESPE